MCKFVGLLGLLSPEGKYMAQAKKASTQKYTALDLFCGCGGLSYGFALAGFDIVGGIDFNKEATETFKLNFPKAKVRCTDITKVTNATIKKLYSGVDVIIGGPPCQSWSEAGALRGINDARGQLFFEYIRILKDKKPKFFLAENVSGMLANRHSEAVQNILNMFRAKIHSIHIPHSEKPETNQRP